MSGYPVDYAVLIREPLKHTLHVAGWQTKPKLLHKF